MQCNSILYICTTTYFGQLTKSNLFCQNNIRLLSFFVKKDIFLRFLEKINKSNLRN